MSTPACREIRHSLGVYVLGAIDPADRALVDDHLAGCPGCREELASLAGLPALLRRVPTAEAERLTEAESSADILDDVSGDHLLAGVLARTAQVRRSRRARELVAAAAVAVLALGAGAAGASVLQAGAPVASPPAHHHVQPAHAWQLVSGTGAKTGATLTVKYRPMPWGTMMTASVAGVAPGTVCQLQVTDSAGQHFVVGGWQVGDYRGTPVWYPASTSLPDARLHSFELVANGKVLARVRAA